jgi:hypothetical protein
MHQTGVGIGSAASALLALASGEPSAAEAETVGVWRERLRHNRYASIAVAS